jgi:hypothetical protein
VTVGREGDKVKPNGKKRMNLRAMAHPRAAAPAVRLACHKPDSADSLGRSGLAGDRFKFSEIVFDPHNIL